MKERIIAYDYIRIVAMLLVVACHCFGDVSTASPATISLLSYFEAPCNGLFFAVSGALLLPVNSQTGDDIIFLKKRLNKVLIPTVFWSIVYLALQGNFSLSSICSIPFSPQGASILWFMYTMIGLYIIAPVISPWLEKADHKTLNVYLGIWAISLCYPIFKNWLTVNETIQGPLYYMSGYAGFFILGYYLKKYGIKLKPSFILYVIAFAIMIAVKLFANDIKLYDGFWYLTIFGAISVVFYWNLLEFISHHIQLSNRVRTGLITISNLIFGVYFIHYGIKEYIIPQIVFVNTMPYLAGYCIRIIIAFGGALILSFIISYLPFANYIIGYKRSLTKTKTKTKTV